MIHYLLDWIAYWIVCVTAFFIRRAPLEWGFSFARGFAAAAHFFLGKRRRVAYANLKAAFPNSTPRQRKQWAKETFFQLGMVAVEMIRSPALTRESINHYVAYHGGYQKGYIDRCRDKKGVILLTAHLGNWELSQIAEGLQGRPMTVLARRQKYRRLDDLLNTFRQYHGSVSVGKGGGIRSLIRTLREGGAVGVLGDQSGGDDGVWIRFFGRLTTSPRGPIALALKLGVSVLPVFMVRRQGPYHDLTFEYPFELIRTGDRERDIQVNTQNYIRLLESYLTKYPTQWLWGHKRWKRTRTKRFAILSDGKPGHVKQSEAAVKEMMRIGERAVPPYEMPVEKIEVEYRSLWHRRVFPLFAFFFIPWAQGRLSWLRLFLKPESSEKLERTNPDVVVSTGAGLAPLNLCLAGENLAKSVVLMKPSFPFDLFRYDLALVPAHDRGWMPGGSFRIQSALSGIDAETMEISKKRLSESLRDPKRIRFGLFLGGETRNFTISRSDLEMLLDELERSAEKLNGDYLITTSRRTPAAMSKILRERMKDYPHCQLCVIACEDKRPEVVPGMMALADSLVVTEDSLSMISEALISGKNVVIVKMSANGLPRKHFRFQEILKNEWGVPVVAISRLSEVLAGGRFSNSRDRLEREQSRIREKLQSLF